MCWIISYNYKLSNIFNLQLATHNTVYRLVPIIIIHTVAMAKPEPNKLKIYLLFLPALPKNLPIIYSYSYLTSLPSYILIISY